ncbi:MULTISPECIES: RagB/SusD family nutrient uptake outer membrane protein [Flavobacteriaceae]|uniref:RagB/SusD family nutrient uptake outer membrane protein n=2 Tax=Flavobacteriaceae TaxID=49546 RepID=A0A4Y8AP57_9FLAO|nr:MULTISPECIES: RagB/SusD family nutrient uptake outer membrane protein [Flavobacteriaceae]TEW72200.1 RagB/SusD family nutrient uptake outer membrane protein [Gramella jeungdoensis]GGK57158.1 outer membrane protein [Lutibacter litoralis]
MKKYSFKILIGTLVTLFTLTSCLNDLDTVPQDKDIILADELFNDPATYKQVLAKIYAGLAISGQQGPAGLPDITGIDEGFSQYLRQYWLAQQVTTDEAVIGWADGSLPDYHEHDWNASNEFVTALYNRIIYQITSCNAFLRETTDGKLSARGVDGQLLENIQVYKSEVRFLRALSYYHAIDLFGNFPFVTENDEVGFFFPEQIDRADLFNFIESELLAIEGTLLAPRANEYARADQAAAWTLLAKLYLNAEVYTGTGRYSDCVTYSEKVINSGYSLETTYDNLFLADNHTSNGVIFPIAFDGLRTQSFGGTTFLIHAAVGGDMDPAEFGINGGWGGNRTTSALVNTFNSGIDLMASNNKIGDATSWGIVGSATPNSWNGPDVVLHQTNTTDVLQAFVSLVDGEIKFRKDNAWNGTDFGDDGSNIAVSAGLYKVTVNVNTQEFKLEKDPRALFYTEGQELEIESISTFTDGYAITKFKNVDQNGNPGSDSTGDFTDTDFPLFRLADVYLMYAEANLRGGGGSEANAISYINELRDRADNFGTVTSINLDFILNERARELYWEGHRRTDLIRFGQFTDGNYVWPWKGGVKEGVSTPAYLNLFPIPATDLNANPNLTQNTGY